MTIELEGGELVLRVCFTVQCGCGREWQPYRMITGALVMAGEDRWTFELLPKPLFGWLLDDGWQLLTTEKGQPRRALCPLCVRTRKIVMPILRQMHARRLEQHEEEGRDDGRPDRNTDQSLP